MAIEVIDTVSAGSADGTNVTTAAVNMTGATFFVAAIASLTGSAAISDSATNSWSLLFEESVGAGPDLFLAYWFVLGPTTSAAQTFTVTDASGKPSVAVMGFSGVRQATADLQTDNEDVGVTEIAVDPPAPSQAPAVYIAAVSTVSGTTFGLTGEAFELVESVNTAAQHIGLALGYELRATAVDPQEITFDWTGSSAAVVGVAAWLEAVSGSAGFSVATFCGRHRRRFK